MLSEKCTAQRAAARKPRLTTVAGDSYALHRANAVTLARQRPDRLHAFGKCLPEPEGKRTRLTPGSKANRQIETKVKRTLKTMGGYNRDKGTANRVSPKVKLD